MSDCRPAWNLLPRKGGWLLAWLLAVLVLHSVCTTKFWNPVFKTSQQGDRLTVSFLKECPNASFYEIQLTHYYTVLFGRTITRSEVGAPIEIIIRESWRKPLRMRVTAFSSSGEMLDIPVETILPSKKPTTTTTPEPTTEVLPPSGRPRVSFVLIPTVVVIVVTIGVVTLVLYLRRRICVVGIQENDDKSSLIPTNQRNDLSDGSEPPDLTEPAGPDPDVLRVHPIYLPGADYVDVVESFLKLLRAHAQVDARPYSSLDVSDDIRSKGPLWVEEQMRHPCLLFLSPGLTLHAVTEPAKDNYNVVQPALTLLRERQDYSNVFVVDIRVEEGTPLNNVAPAAVASRADVGGVGLSRRPRYQGALARRGADGVLQLKDFEKLVKCMHAENFPHRQMKNWENCRIIQEDLLRKIQGLQTEGNGAVAVPIEEVVCECWTNEEDGVPLLNGEANV